jgi:predicted RNA-binding Zn-ribbon protein involved in translation (DUF1610 family)
MAHKNPYWLKPYNIRKGQHISPGTEFKPHSAWVEIPCKNCGKLVRLTKNKAEKYWKGYCSKKCGYLSFSAEKHPNWKGGSSKVHQKIRSSKEYRKWRMKVLVKADFICNRCGAKNSWHAHHKKLFALYPELRFEVENGECLCDKCHSKTKKKNMEVTENDSNNTRYGLSGN